MSEFSEFLSSIVTGIKITDIIDIVIMSFVVYKFIGFVRSTRAEQLAKGIVFLIFFALVANWLELYTVKWILSKILEIGLIALVVVFQPELRRALEFLGRGKLSFRAVTMDRDTAIKTADSISNAIDYFSSHKVGALIVIERETALNDMTEHGTIIDAKTSEELLENIFYVGSPLHDGAVIIRGDRVYAAGCVLPLTENPNLSKDLGTRHRAGIGISEVSDAIVLIVSEETGIISMASDGKLSRFLDLKSVEKTLLAHYTEDRKKGLLAKLTGKGADNGKEEQ